MISRSSNVLLSAFNRETSLCTSTFGFGLRCPVTNVILSQAGGDPIMNCNDQDRHCVVTLSPSLRSGGTPRRVSREGQILCYAQDDRSFATPRASPHTVWITTIVTPPVYLQRTPTS